MRALHIVTLHTPTHDFGGPTRVALNLCGGLRAAGEQAALVALGDGFPEGPLPREVDGVPARLFQARHVLPRFEVSGITSPAMLAGAPALLRSADVVHVHLMRDLVTLPMALLAARLGRPLVLQTHGMIDPTRNRVARAVDVLGLRWVLKRADAVLHLTDTERELTRAVVAPEPMAPAYRLVNGVEPQPARQPAPPGRPPTVLYCARVQEGKRPQDFVGAMPTVLEKHPHARFVMAGPDTGALADDMLALARSLGVGHALEYVGALDHAGVLERLRSSDVYVLPSVKDAFSVSVLESLSVGLPVVVTRTSGLAPDIAASGAGRLVDSAPDDPANGVRVGRAVLELLEPAASAAASEAAWRLAQDSFTLDAVVDTLRGVYERVSGPRPPRATARVRARALAGHRLTRGSAARAS
ncbi:MULTISPECIES: glycosyltransferase [unclassified Streptomyces]|uniref:glycosyltransferase n=1 Tax=unclassified Streptomyces TaxID=2593676 RepID=UPI002DD96977|nr:MULTISPECIES: glycosyltransferase [unclassified Streptomyces]WSA95093.1 glycosyltransferase [Streptomyces sp. NBC_01795]WSB79514.1 glycosyltransferase [Streptomyces sp. NBC_01775]WSS12282.1 glycosyltransferase [Streptomyces sp. NBC_01186]WSS40995.1 glycosyltransferase [Streptomyces sp. NBC_01187]